MRGTVAVAKEADRKQESSSTKSGSSIHRLRDASGRQLGSLRGVVGNIRRDGSTPSADSIATQLSSMRAGERAPALLALQQTHGNRYVQRVVSGIQAKLTVGQPGDKYEQEADRVADAVMRMPEPVVQRQVEPEEEGEEEEIQAKPLAEQITPLVQVQRQEEPEEEEEEEETLQSKPLAEEITPLVQRQVDPEEGEEELQAKLVANAEYPIQRQIDEEEEKEEDLIQTKPFADQITPLVQRQVEEEEEEEILQTKREEDTTSEVTHNLESQIQMIRGGGKSLSESERIYFEPRFGVDFDQVRVHTDTRAVNARAFTTGRDVVFGAGQYAPGTSEGRRLMAHELTHVVQQTHGNRYVPRVVSGIQAKLVVGQPGDVYEQGADRVAEQVMRMPEPGIQRQPKKEEELLRTKPLVEQITPLIQRQVEKKEEGESHQTKINTVHRVVDQNALIREGAPDFKATDRKIPRGTYVKIVRYNTGKTRAEVQQYLPGSKGTPKHFGWTAVTNLVEKHEISGYKTTGTLSEVSWGETSGLYPARMAEYDPEMWDASLTKQLLATRCAVHAIGSRGERVHRAKPGTTSIEQRLKTYHLVENFPSLDPEIADLSVKWFYLSKKAAQPTHPGLNKPHVRVKSYGPFYNNGGGDVSRGGGVYIHFFKLK